MTEATEKILVGRSSFRIPNLVANATGFNTLKELNKDASDVFIIYFDAKPRPIRYYIPEALLNKPESDRLNGLLLEKRLL